MRSTTLRRLSAALSMALLCLSATPHAEQRVTQPYLGITYIDRTEAEPRAVHMHIVQVDLTARGLHVKLSPHDGVREAVRQTTLEFLKQQHAQVAVNVHFFLPFPSTDRDARLVGIAASEGRVYSAFETPEQDFALAADAPGLNIDPANHATIVHRDPAHADGTHVAEAVTLWTTVAGSAQIVTDGVKTLPDLAWYQAVNARTAIGVSEDGRTLTLFTVDKGEGSLGMEVGEVADILVRDYGVRNALNLDGGGSTSLAMEDPVTHAAWLVNASSDRPDGRAVGSSLAVFARPRP